MARESGIIKKISIWESTKIYFFIFVYGIWALGKMIVKWCWNPKKFEMTQQRDTPPNCLVDSCLGQHKYIKLKGVKFHYVESGPPNAPLLLLLHGFPDCWLGWRNQILPLASHFRVVALDLKGFGDSDKPSSRNSYRVDIVLDELHEFIISLGVGNCIIVGHDLGAFFGWCMAHAHPEMIDKLVAVSGAHPNIYRNFEYSSEQFRWLCFAQLPFFPEVEALREDGKLLEKHHRHLGSSDVYLEAYKYAFCRMEDWTGPLNYLRNLLFSEIKRDCRNLMVPVILIVGDKDSLVPLEKIIKSTDHCEKFHLKMIDGAGHFPHQERPLQFNEVLLKYLVKRNGLKEKNLDKSVSRSIMDKMFGAVSSTVKYGNSIVDSVHKRTNIVGGMSLLGYANIYDRPDG